MTLQPHQLDEYLDLTDGPVCTARQVLTTPIYDREYVGQDPEGLPCDSTIAAWLAAQLTELWSEMDGFKPKAVFDEETEDFVLAQALWANELLVGTDSTEPDSLDMDGAVERIKAAIPFLAVFGGSAR